MKTSPLSEKQTAKKFIVKHRASTDDGKAEFPSFPTILYCRNLNISRRYTWNIHQARRRVFSWRKSVSKLRLNCNTWIRVRKVTMYRVGYTMYDSIPCIFELSWKLSANNPLVKEKKRKDESQGKIQRRKGKIKEVKHLFPLYYRYVPHIMYIVP